MVYAYRKQATCDAEVTLVQVQLVLALYVPALFSEVAEEKSEKNAPNQGPIRHFLL